VPENSAVPQVGMVKVTPVSATVPCWGDMVTDPVVPGTGVQRVSPVAAQAVVVPVETPA